MAINPIMISFFITVFENIEVKHDDYSISLMFFIFWNRCNITLLVRWITQYMRS